MISFGMNHVTEESLRLILREQTIITERSKDEFIYLKILWSIKTSLIILIPLIIPLERTSGTFSFDKVRMSILGMRECPLFQVFIPLTNNKLSFFLTWKFLFSTGV